jgi:hypothetical protein
MVRSKFSTAVRSVDAKGEWPVNLDRLRQRVVVSGFAYPV